PWSGPGGHCPRSASSLVWLALPPAPSASSHADHNAPWSVRCPSRYRSRRGVTTPPPTPPPSSASAKQTHPRPPSPSTPTCPTDTSPTNPRDCAILKKRVAHRVQSSRGHTRHGRRFDSGPASRQRPLLWEGALRLFCTPELSRSALDNMPYRGRKNGTISYG